MLLDGLGTKTLAIRVRKPLPSFTFTENHSQVSLSDSDPMLLRLADGYWLATCQRPRSFPVTAFYSSKKNRFISTYDSDFRVNV